MNNSTKQQLFLTNLNLVLTALILLGVIILVGWLYLLDREVDQISSAASELAAQLTLQVTVEAYREEIQPPAEQEEEIETTAAPVSEAPTEMAEVTPAATVTPKSAKSEFTTAFFQQISLVFAPTLNELSDTKYFRLPPLKIALPEGWKYRFDTAGTLTLSDSFNNETRLKLWAKNDWGAFLLNETGYFQSLADGSLGWFPDTSPRQGLGAGEYELTYEINEFTSDAIPLMVEDAPMARILEGIPMYRTYQDLLEERYYRSFSSQQEPMSMFGYTVMPDGSLFIRVWRSHDKYYYWVSGEFVMHPELPLKYNDLEDLLDEDGQEIIPEIETPVK